MRIGVLGPESTGKSLLCKKLALHYRGVWVPEFARYYLMTKFNTYTFDDLEHIAMGQLFWEDLYAHRAANKYIFCDTTLLTIKIWSQWKYGKVAKSIEKLYEERKYDLMLLLDVDVPWTFDSQRENPHDRQELFDFHKKILNETNVKFEIVGGINNQRVLNAINFIEYSKKKPIK